MSDMADIIENEVALRDIETARNMVNHDSLLILAACQLAITFAREEQKIIQNGDGHFALDDPGQSLEERLKATLSDTVKVDEILTEQEKRCLDAAKIFVGLTLESKRARIF